MGNESINLNTNPNKPSLMKELGSSVAFSGAITGFGALSSTARYGGVKKAFSATNLEGFKKLNTSLKTANKDIFTRGVEVAQNYDQYKILAKQARKLEKAAAATAKNGGKLTAWQSFTNLFRSEATKIKPLTVASEAREAANKLKKAGQTIAAGGDIIEEGAKLAGKSGLDTAKNLFRSELKNKFVLGITILGALPRIQEEIIPAFKEKGFAEGIKATGKVIARTAADFVSNAGFSAVGRAIGGAIGSIFPGFGTAIGATFGDVIGSFFSMKLTEKVFDKDKNKIKANQADLANNQQAAEIANKENAQAAVEATKEEPMQEQPEIKAAQDYKTAKAKALAKQGTVSNPSKRTSTYIRPKNGVYATDWVNDIKREREGKLEGKRADLMA